MWEVNHKEGRVLKNWYFQMWCQRKLLRVLWTTRRSNQSILKEINTEYLLEGQMLKLKLQASAPSSEAEAEALATWFKKPTNWKRAWCWERLREGGEGGNRGWNGWMASQTQWTWVWANSGRWWRIGKPDLQQSVGSQRVGHDWLLEQQQQSFRDE